ncbi:hypothetical protein [Haladaptatus sp. DJG-WS-42]|uniref:hypothetical protein n=1 Tax=Haladaptatus sp. DJG-WS-42 TaxID=3120516 RepID=UPI0030CB9CAA
MAVFEYCILIPTTNTYDENEEIRVDAARTMEVADDEDVAIGPHVVERAAREPISHCGTFIHPGTKVPGHGGSVSSTSFYTPVARRRNRMGVRVHIVAGQPN